MRITLCFTMILILWSCHKDRTAEIEQSMRHYDHLILQMNADSIADLYAPDGQLGDQPGIVGRDSISKFLKTFTAFKVLETHSTSDSVSFDHDTAFQSGSYFQRTRIPAGDTLELHGTYAAIWVKKNNRWLIQKMTTKSLPK